MAHLGCLPLWSWGCSRSWLLNSAAVLSSREVASGSGRRNVFAPQVLLIAGVCCSLSSFCKWNAPVAVVTFYTYGLLFCGPQGIRGAFREQNWICEVHKGTQNWAIRWSDCEMNISARLSNSVDSSRKEAIKDNCTSSPQCSGIIFPALCSAVRRSQSAGVSAEWPPRRCLGCLVMERFGTTWTSCTRSVWIARAVAQITLRWHPMTSDQSDRSGDWDNQRRSESTILCAQRKVPSVKRQCHSCYLKPHRVSFSEPAPKTFPVFWHFNSTVNAKISFL